MQQKPNEIFLKKTLLEIFSSHMYASFGTFYVQIGLLRKVSLKAILMTHETKRENKAFLYIDNII